MLGYQSREEAVRRLSGEMEQHSSAAPATPAAAAVRSKSPMSNGHHRPHLHHHHNGDDRAYLLRKPQLSPQQQLLQLRPEEELKRGELRPFPFPEGK